MLIELIILLLAVPLGFLIAWLARDELVDGRKWFKLLIIIAIIMIIYSYLIGKAAIAYTSAFISIVSLISYTKSFDRKWTRKNA